MKRGKQLVIGIVALFTLVAFASEVEAGGTITVKRMEVIRSLISASGVHVDTYDKDHKLYKIRIILNPSRDFLYETLRGSLSYGIESLDDLMHVVVNKASTLEFTFPKIENDLAFGDLECNYNGERKYDGPIWGKTKNLFDCTLYTDKELIQDIDTNLSFKMRYSADKSNVNRVLIEEYPMNSKHEEKWIILPVKLPFSKFSFPLPAKNPKITVDLNTMTADVELTFDSTHHDMLMDVMGTKFVLSYSTNSENEEQYFGANECSNFDNNGNKVHTTCIFDFSNDPDLLERIAAKNWDNDVQDQEKYVLKVWGRVSDIVRSIDLLSDDVEVEIADKDEESKDENDDAVDTIVSSKVLKAADTIRVLDPAFIDDEESDDENEVNVWNGIDGSNGIDGFNGADGNGADGNGSDGSNGADGEIGADFGGGSCSMATTSATSSSGLALMIAALTALMAIRRRKSA